MVVQLRRAYASTLYAQERERLCEQWQANLVEALELARTRAGEGRAARLEVLRLEQELEQVEVELEVELELVHDDRLAEWTELRTLALAAELPVEPPQLAGPLAPAPQGDQPLALPELRALELEVGAANLERDAARRVWVPGLTLIMGYKGVQMLPGRGNGFVAGFALIIPLVDVGRGDRLRAEAQLARARAESSWMYARVEVAHEGLDARVDALTLDSLKAFHDTWYRPNNAYLILSGDVTKDEVRKMVEKTLGTWTPATSFPAHPLEKFAGADYQKAVPTELIVNIVDRNQISADIIIANVNGVARNSPEWNQMAAVVKYFGGGMSSVLFRDIRETQKLTYNINAYQDAQKAVGEFGIMMQTKEVDQMLNALFGHITDLRTKDPDSAYVQSALDNMALSFPLQIETASQIADKVETMLTFNLPETYYNTYIDDVRKVKVEDIKTTAAKHVHPIPVIVIVGKADKVKEQLANVPYLKDAKIVEYDTDLNKK